jgi:general secretion pathway protein G
MKQMVLDPPRDGEVAARSADGGGPGPHTDGGPPPPRATRAVPLPVPGRIERERGFTLVEMMVVIVIIGLLATIVIINVMPATERAAQARVRADLSTIEQAVDMYKLENLRYPTTQEGLNALVPKYIRRLPNDPWNSPYVYVSPGPNGAPYRIASLGADKREGGSGDDADVTN